MKNHAAGRIESWQAERSLPVRERIGSASPQMLEYLGLDNILNGYPNRPRAARLDPAFLADVRSAVAALPNAVWNLVAERLLGVYFVEDLGGTGYTESVRDRSGRHIAAFVVLDAQVLARLRANAWATWKENTPFKPDSSHRLEARIEDDADDDRSRAIRYILLHELGHVASIGSDVHPHWNLAPRSVGSEARYPFLALSWKINRKANRYESRFDAEFPQRASIAYYFGAKLAAADMVPAYTALQKTNFPTLYAATRPGDDFAESFASYVHVVLMKRPWEIRIAHDRRPVQVFRSCWGEARCAAKENILRTLFKGGAAAGDA